MIKANNDLSKKIKRQKKRETETNQNKNNSKNTQKRNCLGEFSSAQLAPMACDREIGRRESLDYSL